MRQLSYTNNPAWIWYGDDDGEDTKIKLLQTLVGVSPNGDLDTATRDAVRKKLPKYVSASTKGVIENIDTIIAELQALNAGAEDGKTESEPWYSKYRYHIGGGVLGLAALVVIAKHKGALGDLGGTPQAKCAKAKNKFYRLIANHEPCQARELFAYSDKCLWAKRLGRKTAVSLYAQCIKTPRYMSQAR